MVPGDWLAGKSATSGGGTIIQKCWWTVFAQLALDQQGSALATADAQGCQAAFQVAAVEFFQEREHQSRSCRADGVSQGDGAAVDVQAGAVERSKRCRPAQFVAGELLGGECLLIGQDDGREGFIELDE